MLNLDPAAPHGVPAPSGGWRAAVVADVARGPGGAVVLGLDVADRVAHLPGQHYVVRLRAPDGYTASRSYSVASAPADPLVELFVERLPDGEVSTFLADVVEVGDSLEVRGPLGGWFVWDGAVPALGVGGGTGVVPLVSMLRHARDVGAAPLLRLAVSARTPALLPYADELVAAGAVVAFTRGGRAGGGAAGLGAAEPRGERPVGRLAAADLAPLVRPDATTYVCGSAVFAEAATRLLVGVGVRVDTIRVERFGPSG